MAGDNVPIVGGWAIGTMTNEHFGYAGDQIGLAAFWFDGARCDIIAEGGLVGKEREVGERLGQRLLQREISADSPVMLFYDAIDRTQGDVRLIMATPLLKGLEDALGFLPDLVGAGLSGDYSNSATYQWTGSDIVQHHALALAFDGEVRIDSVIMHGCRPATSYYTVTKSDRQTILEINGEPALPFLDNLLGGAIVQQDYAFFLIFGINQGEKWGAFNENSYANRLCLGLDRERNGIVMFEPDMVEGTEFQIMYRSLDLGYIAPRIEDVFERQKGRKPVFAFYIDCAGRAAGYAGLDLEDAAMVQKAVAGRVPLLGIYSGVEIASVSGSPRALDWTGVFCLFSVPE